MVVYARQSVAAAGPARFQNTRHTTQQPHKAKKKREKKLTAYLYGHERRRDKNDIF